MNKWRFTQLVIALGLFAALPSAPAQEAIRTLRGEVPIDAETVLPDVRNALPDSDPIPRDFVQQPPLIPHDVKAYTINIKSNKCLSCHSWTNYKASGATKISQTHFSDRTEHVLADVAPRRYFCTQCHVPQMDARPLVDNDFAPLTRMNGR